MCRECHYESMAWELSLREHLYYTKSFHPGVASGKANSVSEGGKRTLVSEIDAWALTQVGWGFDLLVADA